MTGVLGTLQLAGLAALSFAALAAVASAFLYPAVSRWTKHLPAASRARLLLIWSAAPVLAGVMLTALCFVPSILSAFGVADHCLVHDDQHTHLCFVHHPATAGAAVGWLLLAGATLCAVVASASRVPALLRARRLLRSMASVSRLSVADVVRVVESATPLTLAAGTLQPEIYVSSGLLHAVTREILDVVLEHERAHVARWDGVRKLVAMFLSFAHLPWVRKRLLDDLGLACEQACDEEAATRVGDRLRVAEAIVAIERTCAKEPVAFGALASAFGGSNVVARVEALLAEPPKMLPTWSRRWWVLALIVGLAAAEPLHHVTETLLGFFVR